MSVFNAKVKARAEMPSYDMNYGQKIVITCISYIITLDLSL